jgi:hypothetical protein
VGITYSDPDIDSDADTVSWAAITRAAGFDTFVTTPSSANFRSLLTDETGTGAAVFATSPTLVTPLLGTPTSGTLTNCDGLPVATGISGLAAGVATLLATFSSANLATALSDETGSGSAVFANTPTLVTPVLGVATATSINKVALTAPATSATLTIADGKTLTASNTITFTATDGSTLAIGTGGTLGTAAYGTIGSTVQAYDAGLAALAAFNTNGILCQTAADTFAGRTLAGTAAEITVTNGDGVSGAPTFSLPAALTFTSKTITGGTFASPTFSGTVAGTPTWASAQTFPSGTTISGNLVLSGASSPFLDVMDTTNNVRGFLQADDDTVNIGSITNHTVIFYHSNNAKATLTASGMGDASSNLFLTTATGVQSAGSTGGTGSGGAGNQYIAMTVGATTYKILHDGTV